MIIVVVASVLICFYQKYFGLTTDAYESALNSLIVSLVVLVVTVVLINLLFSHHHEKINKEKEKKDYVDVLKKSHDSLVHQLKTYIITFVTKEMAVTSPDENKDLKHNIKLIDLKNQLDQYITNDFYTKGIEITELGKINLFDFNVINLKHTEWVLDNNNKILANIHKYLMLYSKLMPNEILKLLVEIELIITQEGIFMVPNVSSAQNPLDTGIIEDKSLKVAKNQLVQMINKIIEFEKSV